MPPRQRRFGLRLAAVGLLAICLATLWPAPEEVLRAGRTPVHCIVCGDTGGVDFTLNILLFIPFGIGLAIAGFSVRRSLALSLLLSFSVELLQMKGIPGRDASLGDLLANTAGGGLGAALGAVWPLLVWPDQRLARRLALGLALCLWWVWAGTAWALGPSFPQGVQWFGGWAPEFDNYEQFQGRVLAVTAGGEPLLPGPALDLPRLEDALTANPNLNFSALLGARPHGLAPISVIVDDLQRTVMLIGQDGDDLQYGYRMRAAILRLRNPRFTLRRGLMGSPGDTVSGTGALRGGTVALDTKGSGRQAGRRQALNASWGWSLIAPWQVNLGDSAPFLTAVWIGGLLALVGYWSASARGVAVTIPVVTWLVLLILIPIAAGFEWPPVGDWVAAIGGTGLGVAGWKMSSRGRPEPRATGETES